MPLDFTIDIILKRIYENNKIITSLTKSEMKEMLISYREIFILPLNPEYMYKQMV